MADLTAVPQAVNFTPLANNLLAMRFVPREINGDIQDLTGFNEATIYAAPQAADKLKFNGQNLALLATRALAVQAADAAGITVTANDADLAPLSEDCFDLPMSYFVVVGDGTDTLVAGYGNMTLNRTLR